MRQLPRALLVVGRGQVSLADHLRVGRGIAAQIEQIAEQHQHAVLLRRVAECQIAGAGRRLGPIAHPVAAATGRRQQFALLRAVWRGRGWLAEVRRLLRHALRIQSLRRHLEHAGASQVVPQHLVENPHERLRRARGVQVRDRDHGEFGGLVDLAGEDRPLLRIRHRQRRGRRR